MKTPVLRWAAILFCIAAPAIGATGSFFGNARCLEELEEIDRILAPIFQGSAERHGLSTEYSDAEAAEFYERMKRFRFLRSELSVAAEDHGAVMHFGKLMAPHWQSTPQKMAKAVQAVARHYQTEPHLGEWLSLILAFQTKKTPTQESEQRLFEQIFGLRFLMYEQRMAFSEVLLRHPMNRTVLEMPHDRLLDLWKRAGEMGSDVREQYALSWYVDELAEVEKIDEADFEQLLQNCLASGELPREVKHEIERELLFESKYNFPPSSAFRAFVLSTAKYFEID